MRNKITILVFFLAVFMTLAPGYDIPVDDLFDLVPGATGEKHWITLTIYYEPNPCAYCLDGDPPGGSDLAVKEVSWAIRMQTSKKPEEWKIFTGRAQKDLIDCTLFPEYLQELCEEYKSKLHPGCCGVPLCFLSDQVFLKNMIKAYMRNEIIVPVLGKDSFVISDYKGFVYQEDENKEIFLTVDLEITVPRN